jgi:hypothetical protein
MREASGHTGMARAKAIELLSGLELLPLEKCTSDAAEWRQEIADVIRGLRGGGLPPDDPLRYQDGKLVSEERLQRRLQVIIDSWPSWEKEKKRYGRKKHYSRSR